MYAGRVENSRLWKANERMEKSFVVVTYSQGWYPMEGDSSKLYGGGGDIPSSAFLA
jgi:hypothetical protein